MPLPGVVPREDMVFVDREKSIDLFKKKLDSLGEQPETQSVLVLRDGELTLSELMNKAGINQVAAYNSIKKLVELGWISETKQKEFPFTRTSELTDGGGDAASSLIELEKLC